jgi:HK97 family phage prohead protease
VEPSGAEVANFMRNPVVLADHDYTIGSVIGKATRLSIDGDGIHATTKFHDKGLGQEAFDLVEAGMVRAWSVGFKPIETDSVKDKHGVTRGFHFKKWELLEYSLVAIPANPDAVMEAVKRGLVAAGNTHIFFRSVLPTDTPSHEARTSATADPGPQDTPRMHTGRYEFLLDFSKRVRQQARADAFKAGRNHE